MPCLAFFYPRYLRNKAREFNGLLPSHLWHLASNRQRVCLFTTWLHWLLSFAGWIDRLFVFVSASACQVFAVCTYGVSYSLLDELRVTDSSGS